MIYPRSPAVVLLMILLVSCAPQKVEVPTSAPSPAAIPTIHAPEIRFGLIGTVTRPNVWSLFDSKGYSYNNYAVESNYWPRLYDLSIPDRKFEAQAASGLPSTIQQEGSLYTGTVPLRTDLTWTDGTPLTAEDVAFTANTVLSFQLGFDWGDAYSPDWLDHVEAVNTHLVKFYFKLPPNAGVWQYGVLQGPIVQMGYWSTRIAAATAHLPASDLSSQIEGLKSKVEVLQARVNALYATSGTTTPEQVRQAQASLTRQQGDLDQAMNDLSKAQANFDSSMAAAREAVYALNDQNEPRLGAWEYAGTQNGLIQNQSNPKFPLEHPNFDRAVYRLYASESAATAALRNGDVNLILTPNDLAAGTGPDEGSTGTQNSMISRTHGLRFLVLNPLSQVLSDPALRKALVCVLEPETLVSQLQGKGASLTSFVLPQEGDWFNANAVLPCAGLDSASRLASGIQALKSAGYTWAQEPSPQTAGQGLTLPNGKAVPSIALLAPASDTLRAEAAAYVQQQARSLGIPLTARMLTSEEINYEVFSSHEYDAAILGWTVSAYPGYLCSWFGAGNPFLYSVARLTSACETLNSTSDLGSAHQQVFEIQSILADDLPFIPLFSGVTVEAYHMIRYPFAEALDGLSSVYGAPSLAIPASP